MTKHVIPIEIDESRLHEYTPSHLAMAWHAAQFNPADGFDSKAPGKLAERIGREIIRRWLKSVEPEIYHHQGEHYYWKQLTRFARFEDGVWVARPEPEEQAAGGEG